MTAINSVHPVARQAIRGGYVMRVKDDPATRLRVLMAEYGYTTRLISQETGLSERTVSGIRSGRIRRPNIDTMYLIAEALKVSINDIWPDV